MLVCQRVNVPFIAQKIENNHWKCEFSHWKWWFLIGFCMFTRGYWLWSPSLTIINHYYSSLITNSSTSDRRKTSSPRCVSPGSVLRSRSQRCSANFRVAEPGAFAGRTPGYSGFVLGFIHVVHGYIYIYTVYIYICTHIRWCTSMYIYIHIHTCGNISCICLYLICCTYLNMYIHIHSCKYIIQSYVCDLSGQIIMIH